MESEEYRMNQSWEREMTVVTPEQVQLRFQTAGVGSRAGAQMIDLVLIGSFYLLLAAILGEGITGLTRSNITSEASSYLIAVFIGIVFLVSNLYYIALEYFMGGKTVGKKIVGIRVIQDNGQSLTLLSAILRNLFRLVDSLPLLYGLGAVVCFFHPRDKRVGDLIAGTVVVIDHVRDRELMKRRLNKELAKRSFALPELNLQDVHKKRITHEDWQLLSSYMQRLPQLNPSKRLELGQQITQYLLKRLELEAANMYDYDPVSFLVALYQQLREEREF
jgi:uncharacterized RDD family membrane protein YckC